MQKRPHISGGTSGSSTKLLSSGSVNVSFWFVVFLPPLWLSFTILLKSMSPLLLGSTSSSSFCILRSKRNDQNSH